MTNLEKATNYLLKHPGASVNNLAQRIGVSYSYAHKLKQKVTEALSNNPLTPEQDAAMDKLITLSQTEGHWQTSVNINSPMEVQIAGSHYKGKRIQPVEYIHANNLNFLEGCIVKRITRWRDKDGFQDLEKIKHEIDLLIEMEKKYANK
jgi:hypothetical protein